MELSVVMTPTQRAQALIWSVVRSGRGSQKKYTKTLELQTVGVYLFQQCGGASAIVNMTLRGAEGISVTLIAARGEAEASAKTNEGSRARKAAKLKVPCAAN